MKASQKILLEEISTDLNQFLKNGNFASFSKEIDPNLNGYIRDSQLGHAT